MSSTLLPDTGFRSHWHIFKERSTRLKSIYQQKSGNRKSSRVCAAFCTRLNVSSFHQVLKLRWPAIQDNLPRIVVCICFVCTVFHNQSVLCGQRLKTTDQRSEDLQYDRNLCTKTPLTWSKTTAIEKASNSNFLSPTLTDPKEA